MALNATDSTAIGSAAGMAAGTPFGPAGMMVGSTAGGLIGGMFGKKNYNKQAMELLRQAQARIMAIPQPSAQDLQYVLEPLVQQGVLDPEDFDTIMAEPSEFMNINLDPTGRNAEVAALNELQGIVDKGGRDAGFEQGMAETISRLNSNMRGQRDAAMMGNRSSAANISDVRARGVEDAMLANKQGIDVAASAEKRAIDALIAKANLGGQITQQDYAIARDKAAAMDAIAKYNAQNSQSVANMNTQGRNVAQAGNLDLANQFEVANKGQTNEMARNKATSKQTVFDNALKQAGAAAGVSVPMAQLSSDSDKAYAATQGNMIGGLGQNLTNYYSNKNMVDAMNKQPQPQPNTPPSYAPQNQWELPGGGGWWEGGQIPSFEEGGMVPGEAPFPGDHPGNDTVVARLSPGEEVIPRTDAEDMRENEPTVEDVQKVLEALTGIRNSYWKGGKVGAF